MLTPGNPSAFTAGHPPHVPPSKRAAMIHWAQWGVLNNAKFEYTQSHPQRSEMFHREPGDLKGIITADCSQFYAAIAHWCGVPGMTDTDYTGTLLEKGKIVRTPTPGDGILFGGGTGEHIAMVTYNGYCIGFGHSPGAPNRVKRFDMIAWFKDHGHPGVRYLSFVH